MNLFLLLGLSILFVLAFTIGMNMGIHGVIAIGGRAKLVAPKDRRGAVAVPVQPTPPPLPVLSGGGVMVPPTPLVQTRVPPLPPSPPLPRSPPPLPSPPSPPPASKVTHSGGATTTNTKSAAAAVAAGAKKPTSALAALNDIYSCARIQDTIVSASKVASEDAGGDGKGPIERFLASGEKVPILLLTCNRPDQLEGTLKSLLAVRGVVKEKILVSQDGAMQAVADVVRKHGIKLIQNTDGIHLRGGAAVDGAERIARHYKYSLSAAFQTFSTPVEAPAVIIVEDDLLFSPDFYEYLVSTAPVLEKDPTTFVVSAWNDNGFKGRVGDPYALKRTEYFPGLGWLLPRALYKKELEARWPTQHWDHWLRSAEVHGAREIVYPEVPRTFHNGIVGTFMDLNTHNKYFRDIDYNTNARIVWDAATGTRKTSRVTSPGGDGGGGGNAAEATGPAVSIVKPESVGLLPMPAGVPNYVAAMRAVHEARVDALLAQCTHLTAATELASASAGVVCVWIDIDPTEPDGYLGKRPEFEPLSMFFGIWHEHRRGGHRGMHEFFYNGKYVLVINVRERPGEYETYRAKMPPGTKLLDPRRFDKAVLLLEQKRVAAGVVGTASTEAGLSCTQVCQKKGQKCRVDFLPLFNTCPALNEKFPCHECELSLGADQPAYVSLTAKPAHGPGKCVITERPAMSTCDASHPSTLRLCPCA